MAHWTYYGRRLDPIGECTICGEPIDVDDSIGFEVSDQGRMWCVVCAEEHLPHCPICEEIGLDRQHMIDHLRDRHEVTEWRAAQMIDEPFAIMLR